MPEFGPSSMNRLATCHVDIQEVFIEVVKHFDCKVIWGHRGEEAQNEAFDNGFSGKQWPDSLHNRPISDAIDCPPYPIVWHDLARFRYFAGVVMGIAIMMEIPLIWGGDWDGDTDLNDQKLNDLAHFQRRGV